MYIPRKLQEVKEDVKTIVIFYFLSLVRINYPQNIFEAVYCGVFGTSRKKDVFLSQPSENFSLLFSTNKETLE